MGKRGGVRLAAPAVLRPPLPLQPEERRLVSFIGRGLSASTDCTEIGRLSAEALPVCMSYALRMALTVSVNESSSVSCAPNCSHSGGNGSPPRNSSSVKVSVGVWHVN
jgi:hypothetical protein